ncbi:carbohydrate kinase family protein [Candidatus Contubernalis alkaliaceticus]|uniref:carbohydrate kinase family protein n=1 Tax=Candidatus Contubernalis alkaliaceticus TaxID=338645 RepID=UPI001F4C2555|nr:carbohydrate kinase family protein [Candidatus Contubernalis alkalaceticus]UNC90869.1 carbohydrate kinase family protein [Candidatus Contubernalis alkalaceticus]
MTADVIGLGASAMDIVLTCEELPREDGFAFIHSEKIMPGGSCANVMVALKKLGIKAALTAKIGDDHYGRLFQEQLFNTGVETSFLVTKKGGTTLHTFITVARNGKKAIYANLGDSLLELTEDEVSVDILRGAKVFYTDMFGAAPALKLARECRRRNIQVVFNLQCSPSFMNFCGVSSEQLEEMIALCHLLVVCKEGMKELAGTDVPKDAGAVLYSRYSPDSGLITTHGEEGSVWWRKDQVVQCRAFPVKAVDTTGAGDAFTGGLISAYYFKNNQPEDALKFASACAAIKCIQPGARLDTSEKEVKTFIKEKSFN